MSDAAKIMLDAPEWHEIERRLNAYDDMLAALLEIEASVYGRKEKPSDHAKYLGDIARTAIVKIEGK